MHRWLIIILLATSAEAATTLHATTTASLLVPMQTQGIQGGCSKTSATTPWDYSYLLMDTTAPSSGTSEIFIPTATSPPCFFQRSTANSSKYFVFVSKPLSAGITISGNVSGACAGVESVLQANAACSFVLYKWDGKLQQLVEPPVWTSGNTVEFGSSCAAKAVASSGSATTTMAVGDRLFLFPEAETVGTWGGDGTRTIGLCYNGAAASANEVSITLTENLTFSADTASPGMMLRVTSD